MPAHLRSSHRAYSFPPWLEMAEHEASQSELPDIDDDPFSHFLTEADDPYELSLSAGIVHDGLPSKASKFKSNCANKWARYVQHSHSNLHNRYHTPTIQEEDDDDNEETFMQMNDSRLHEVPQVVSQISPPKITISDASRGRPQDLAARKTRRARYSRTLSGHRHSWREPSPDLFTVDESEEEETSVLRRTRTRKPKEGSDRRRSSTRSRSRAKFDVTEKSRL